MNNTAGSIFTVAATRLPRRCLAMSLNGSQPGSIAFNHSNGVITELARFRFPMTIDDEDVAKCFGLEIARLLLDSSFGDFAKTRYEREKRMARDSRQRWR